MFALIDWLNKLTYLLVVLVLHTLDQHLWRHKSEREE